jgi:hypothetical protein
MLVSPLLPFLAAELVSLVAGLPVPANGKNRAAFKSFLKSGKSGSEHQVVKSNLATSPPQTPERKVKLGGAAAAVSIDAKIPQSPPRPDAAASSSSVHPPPSPPRPSSSSLNKSRPESPRRPVSSSSSPSHSPKSPSNEVAFVAPPPTSSKSTVKKIASSTHTTSVKVGRQVKNALKLKKSVSKDESILTVMKKPNWPPFQQHNQHTESTEATPAQARTAEKSYLQRAGDHHEAQYKSSLFKLDDTAEERWKPASMAGANTAHHIEQGWNSAWAGVSGEKPIATAAKDTTISGVKASAHGIATAARTAQATASYVGGLAKANTHATLSGGAYALDYVHKSPAVQSCVGYACSLIKGQKGKEQANA